MGIAQLWSISKPEKLDKLFNKTICWPLRRVYSEISFSEMLRRVGINYTAQIELIL